MLMKPYVLAHQGAWRSYGSDLENVTVASSGGQQMCNMALRDAELCLTSRTATLRNGNAQSAVNGNHCLSNMIPSVQCDGY